MITKIVIYKKGIIIDVHERKVFTTRRGALSKIERFVNLHAIKDCKCYIDDVYCFAVKDGDQYFISYKNL